MRRHLLAIAMIMTGLAVYGLFVPMQFRSLSWEQAVSDFRHVPLLDLGIDRRADFVANIVLFVPLGFFWLGAVDLHRSSRRAAWLFAPLLALLLMALAITLEFAQQWTVRRTVSQNDIIAESMGGIIGIAFWLIAGRWFIARVQAVLTTGGTVASRQEQSAAMLRRWRGLLLLYAIGFVLYNIQPLDLAISAASLRQKFDAGRFILLPFHHWLEGGFVFNRFWHAGCDVLLFVPVGLLLRLGLQQPRTLWNATLLALLAAAAIESMQIFIFTRTVDATDLITLTMGGFIGAEIGGMLLSSLELATESPGLSFKARWRISMGLLAVLTALLLIYSWQPYDFHATHEQFIINLRHAMHLPFTGHYAGSEFNAMTKVISDGMYFLPFGLLLSWTFAPGDRQANTGLILTMTAALLIGSAIEIGQAATLTRYADITSVMINILGAMLGWWLWRLVSSKPVIR